jgi:hypothetical protein
MCAALEKLDDNRVWGNVRENFYISAKEYLSHYKWKLHKPGSDEKCSEFVH